MDTLDTPIQTCAQCGHTHKNSDGTCGVDGCSCAHSTEGMNTPM